MLRKRYRPLDTAEERTVGVEQVLQVGLLHDEQSYCFSWPEAPLTSTLCRSNESLAVGMQGGFPAAIQRSVAQPPIHGIEHIVADQGKEMFVASISAEPFLISMKKGSESGATQRFKRPLWAPLTTSSEDSVFSLTDVQILDMKNAGVFDAFRKVPRSFSRQMNDEELENIAQLQIEEEIVKLEWRAFQESDKTAPALQRILYLATAVPFLETEVKKCPEGFLEANDVWRRIVYNKWLEWRQRRGPCLSSSAMANIDVVALSWGSPILPGAYLAFSAQDYFLQPNDDRNGEKKSNRPNEKFGGGDDHVLSSTASRRRGAYNYLRWRMDIYEPRLRSNSGAFRSSGAGHSMGGSSKLLNDDEVVRLISEKLPASLLNVELDERVDPLDTMAMTDIRSEVETWRQWLAHV